jgi:tetratricopeptide (TPR) repeat protein
LYGEAVTNLRKAKEINPQFADASYNLGLTLLKLDKTLEAQKEWEYTTTIAPTHARALYNLGLLYQQADRLNDGLTMFCRFVAASGNQFQVEVTAARQAIETHKFKCQN